MSKFTKIRNWAEANGYKVEDTYAYGNMPAVKVTINEENHFKCAVKESTRYYSVHGVAGDRGGLYLTHKHTPKSGKFFRTYDNYMPSQDMMIISMEHAIKKIKKEDGVKNGN